MLPALYDRERSALLRWALLIAGGACALAPLNGASSGSGVPLPSAREDRQSSQSLLRFRLPSFHIGRDPFIPQVAELPADAVVRAVVLGETPHALIEIGSRTMLVGIGDVLGGVRVEAIDDTGVLLSDGSRVPLHGVTP